MDVKLVSVTKPCINGIKSAEQLISYCARVSNPSNQLNVDTAPKLLKYCIDHQHWSIFEMANMCVEIKTSRAIAAQILRHRSFSFQEFSQRYSAISKLEQLEFRLQGKTNRQVGDGDVELTPYQQKQVDRLQEESLAVYQMLIESGVARESARMILPLNTQTTLYMTGTIRSWITYLQLRCKVDTQKEHRDIAEAIKEIFKQEFPFVSEALKF
jgi:thymidylate synthase (FAD)